MSPSKNIGFAILTHSHPEQLLHLVKTLNLMFDEPPIVCHHNFTKCPLDTDAFPSNVRFARPHIDSLWGHISLPLAAVKALQILSETSAAEWFFLLSGSDYPVRPASEIIDQLAKTEFDVCIDSRPVRPGPKPATQNAKFGFNRPAWVDIALIRYYYPRIGVPLPSLRRLRSGAFPFRKRWLKLRAPWIKRLVDAFTQPFEIFGGDLWFHANRKAIERLVRTPSEKLAEFYNGREIPEESYLHTILCNTAGLKISTNSRRYSDWRHGGWHPRWLEISDVDEIHASDAYFARKFRPDGIVQSFIDRELLRVRDLTRPVEQSSRIFPPTTSLDR